MPYQNPFFNRKAITDIKYFCGRKKEIKEILHSILTSQCTSIIGERRLGKSSLLRFIAHQEGGINLLKQEYNIDPKKYIFLYFELMGYTDITQSEFLREIIGKLTGNFPQNEIRFKDFRLLIEKLYHQGINVVILFDEFEYATENKNLDIQFFGGLRTLANSYNLIFITATRKDLLQIQSESVKEKVIGSPFFNIFNNIYIREFQPVDVDEMFKKYLVNTNVSFSESDSLFIKKISRCHPYLVQVASYHLFDAYIDNDIVKKIDNDKDRYNYVITRTKESVVGILKDYLEDSLREYYSEGSGSVEKYDSDEIRNILQQRYEMISEIKKGGMGVIYKAKDKILGRLVAIKFGFEDSKSRIEKEAKCSALVNHSNILQIYDVNIQERFIVMEFIDGKSLREILEDSGRIAINEAIDIMKQMMSALSAIHSANIVHRDIKPENILIKSENNRKIVKIMDFGLALIQNDKDAPLSNGDNFGTVIYMSPEQLRFGNIDYRTDIYSAGIVFYEMLTGERPFTTSDLRYQNIQDILGSESNILNYSKEKLIKLNNIILKCLKQNLDERYGSADEVLKDLNTLDLTGF